MLGMRVGLCIGGLLLALGCTKPNPNYCEANPEKDCRIDASTRCETHADCGASTPVCEPINGTCVQCTRDRADACIGTAPFCDDNSTCRGCKAHAECDSLACLPTGACGTSQVAYVDPQGNQNAICSVGQPCSTIAAALMTQLPYIKIHGVLDERVTILDRNVTLLADPGATLTASTIGPIITIDGGSDVSIYDLTVRGALGTNMGWGIYVREPTSGIVLPTLNLERVVIRESRLEGIASSLSSTVRMSKCVVTGNHGGGAMLLGSYDVSNSLFVVNGAAGSSTGGLFLQGKPGSTFHFNTVADNVSDSTQNANSGINCATPIPTTNNIIANNLISPNCSPDYSLLDLGGGPAAHNRFGNPQFKNRNYASTLSPDYYRITDSSPAIDGADPASSVHTDIDGDSRPNGSAPDMGADEYAP